jgi:hypothetical protein
MADNGVAICGDSGHKCPSVPVSTTATASHFGTMDTTVTSIIGFPNE